MKKEVGALISLQPNASKIATKFGLDEFLASKGPLHDRAFRIFNMDGELQHEIPTNMSVYGAQRSVYHRADLHDALLQAAISIDGPGNPAKILNSSRVKQCDCEQGLITLENGEILEGDLIVGADGIHSTLREIVAGPNISKPQPTGISAYRILLETADLEGCQSFLSVIDPHDPATAMVVGHDKRIIMGPARNGDLYGVVALVPDQQMHEVSNTDSWTSEGSLVKVLETFAAFPPWIKELFSASKEAPALYQLRDIDPLKSWYRGRVILIGDAAHAMLPTQGQGASQSFEDAEALQAFLAEMTGPFNKERMSNYLKQVFETRHERASLIQAYSRQQARPATDKNSKIVKLDPAEFMDYNCNYEGAKAWRQQQISLQSVPVLEDPSSTVEVRV